jgi:hypothetical protein
MPSETILALGRPPKPPGDSLALASASIGPVRHRYKAVSSWHCCKSGAFVENWTRRPVSSLNSAIDLCSLEFEIGLTEI